MYALIMAGGQGKRLAMGEKALARIGDRPLLSYILNAILEAELFPIVITSPNTPYTTNYCRAHYIDWLCTSGKGYIEDLHEAVIDLDIIDPFFTICADLPGITADHIRHIKKIYDSLSCEALSVWIPVSEFIKNGQGIPVAGMMEDATKIPAGLNIIRGDLINRVQYEEELIIEDPRLALNINTLNDLIIAEKMLGSS